VSTEDEIQGLDVSQHGEDGYGVELDLIPAEMTMGSLQKTPGVKAASVLNG
jgi:hypothetical protein